MSKGRASKHRVLPFGSRAFIAFSMKRTCATLCLSFLPVALACGSTARNFGGAHSGTGGVAESGDNAGGGGTFPRGGSSAGRAELGGDTAAGAAGEGEGEGDSGSGGEGGLGGADAASSSGSSHAGGSAGKPPVDGAGGSSPAGGSGGSGGLAPICSSSETLCTVSNSCRDLTKDIANCGSCGHDCGGLAACADSRCTSAPIITGLVGASGMDVSVRGVFYLASGLIQYCTDPLRCLATTQQIGDPPITNTLVVTKSETTQVIAYYGKLQPWDKYSGYYSCSITGCGATLIGAESPMGGVGGITAVGSDFYFQTIGNSTMLSTSYVTRRPALSDGSTGTFIPGDFAKLGTRVAVDEQYMYYVRTDANGLSNVVPCNRLTGCAVYTPFDSGDPTNFAAYGGKLYWTNGIVLKRADAANPTVTTQLATLSAAYDGEMLVDEKNIYWLTATSIAYCSLPTCVGGVKTLVSSLVSPKYLRSQANFLYWLIPSASTESTGAIYRVAKP